MKHKLHSKGLKTTESTTQSNREFVDSHRFKAGITAKGASTTHSQTSILQASVMDLDNIKRWH